ncbi:MAG: thioredoxin family protein [Rhodothermales bacterium]|nr:thioredoxin family protein [Rhodothermales bacterium]
MALADPSPIEAVTAAEAFERTRTRGLTYAAFRAAWDEKLDASPSGLSPDERKYRHYAKYNRERSAAVHAAYTPSERVRAALAASPPLTALVITEDWCGDSAFALPVIAEAFATDPRHTLRILPRDEHLDVMERYLTNGGRSIPKMVLFDADGTEHATWGPRTASGQAHRATLVAEGLDYAAIAARMVTWYEAGGWQDVDGELAALVDDIGR